MNPNESNLSRNLPVEIWMAGAACGLFLGLLIWDQSHWWLSRDEYNFGLFVPVFVGWVLWDRWPRIRHFLNHGAPVPDPDGPDLPPPRAVLGKLFTLIAWVTAIGALLLFGVGAVLRSAAEAATLPTTQAWAWAFAIFVLSVSWIVSSSVRSEVVPVRHRLTFVGYFVFPALIWLISAPLLDFAERRVSLVLLNKVVSVVYFSFELLNYPLEKKGNVLVLPRGEVGVEDACSGIRSLTACIFAGSFMAAMYANRLWKKFVMIGMSMALAVFMNLCRSLFLTAWAYVYGSDAISGNFHDITGYAVLGLTWLGLLVLVPIINFQPNFDLDDIEEDSGALPPPA